MHRITLNTLNKMKREQHKFACLTVYDASFASLMEAAGVDILFIGDSLGNVVQGLETTLPVSIDDVAYHTACVARARKHALLMADMPFMTYATVEDALRNAAILMQAGAEIVKLEGGAWLCETVERLTQNGVPVCVHLGLTPQSVNVLGGFLVQGKTPDHAERILQDCLALDKAGARMITLECVPSNLARKITDSVKVPVMGIGAGPDCDGQVLVMHDMLGVSTRPLPKFVKNFMQGAPSIEAAFKNYVLAVKEKIFPIDENGF